MPKIEIYCIKFLGIFITIFPFFGELNDLYLLALACWIFGPFIYGASVVLLREHNEKKHLEVIKKLQDEIKFLKNDENWL